MPDDPKKVAEEEEEIADEGTETEADEGAEPDSAVEDEGDESGDDQDQGDHAEADARGDEGAKREAEVAVRRKPSDIIRDEKRQRKELERQLAEERRAREAAEARAAERRRVEDEETERRRLELMTPEERADYRVRKAEEGFGRQLGGLRFEMQDTADKSRFESLCARKPHFARIADEVEAELAAMRRNGSNVTRENLAKFMLGQELDRKFESGSGAAAKKRRRGQERLAAQTTRPGRAGSDVAAERQPSRRGDTREARLARLEGKTF